MADPVERLQRALADRYRIERLLGAGAMAIVYLAEDLKHGRSVAVKVMGASVSSHLALQRFSREIQIVAQLQHPHIMPLFDSGNVDGAPYYVMPVVHGESLRDRLRRDRQLPVDVALRIARDVARALAYAHGQGVIHRDIKPENVLLEGDHTLLADFGVAQGIAALGDEKLTETGIAVGTPVYMSPEQAAGEPEIDARSDIYSLGCVLYEMLVGEPPFSGPTTQAMLARKLTAPIPTVCDVRDAVPASVERVITKALARTPADRYRTAHDFAVALDRAESPESAPAAPNRPRVSQRARRGVIVAIATAAAATAAWPARDRLFGSRDQFRSIALLPFENMSHDTALDYRVDGMHDLLVDELSRVTSLRVIPRTSVVPYRASPKPLPTIARELRVDVLATGSVRWTGDSVSVTVRLIQPRPERQLSAETFRGTMRSSPEMQKAIAASIVRQLHTALTADERARLALNRPAIPAAREAYLKGLSLTGSFTPDGMAKGIAYLEDAIRLDSTDPGPRAALAEALTVYGIGHGNTLERERTLLRAKAAALGALRLDSSLADAHSVLGGVRLFHDWDWSGSEEEFKRAIALNPNSGQAHWGYSCLLVALRRFEEAIAENVRAKELDPLSNIIGADLAGRYWAAGQYRQAVATAREVLDFAPAFPPAHFILGIAYREQGEYEKAIRAHERAAALSPVFRPHLAITYAVAGRRKEARETIAAMDTLTKRWAAQYVAAVHAALGERDAVLRWLEVAYEEHDPFFYWVRLEPAFRVLDNEPRYQSLIARTGLPQS